MTCFWRACVRGHEWPSWPGGVSGGETEQCFCFFLFQELHPLKLPPPAIRQRRKDDDDIDDNGHVRFVHCSGVKHFLEETDGRVKYCEKMLMCQVLSWSQQETQSSTLKSSPPPS